MPSRSAWACAAWPWPSARDQREGGDRHRLHRQAPRSRSHTSSTLANGVPWLIGWVRTPNPRRCSAACQSASERHAVGGARWPRASVTAWSTQRLIQKRAVAPGRPRAAAGGRRAAAPAGCAPARRPARPGRRSAARRAPRPRRTASNAVCRMSPQIKRGRDGRSARACSARATSRRHQLDAGVVHAARRRTPWRGPASGRRQRLALGQQAGQQGLAATDVEHTRARRDRASRPTARETPDRARACRARSAS